MIGPDPAEQKGESVSESLTPGRTILIFVDGWDSAATSEHIEAIVDAFPHWEFVILQQFSKPRLSTYVRRKIRQFVRTPISFSVRTVLHFSHKLKRRRRRLESPVHPPEICSEIRRPNLRYRRFPRLHSPEALEFARSFHPWLGLSIGAPILKKPLFSIPQLGTINIHKSLLPNYRGMPYGFWELHDGATISGVSIHRVDEGLDSGPILYAQAHQIPPFSTIQGLGAELDQIGTNALINAIKIIDKKGEGFQEDLKSHEASGPANRMPSWFLARRVHKRLWKKRLMNAATSGWLRQFCKSMVLHAYLIFYAKPRNLILGLFGRSYTSILLYHRVSDCYLDRVSVGIEQFEQHLDFLSRHYDVIDLPEYLASRGLPRSRPAVVLTFDDGYADNYLAAILLRRAGLPCTFFISTGIVGTDRAFQHDLRELGHRVPMLSWDQVRQMRDWGFQIANHTQTHPDIGIIHLEQALAEISQASSDLEHELGPIDGRSWFAYPFGKPNNITDEVRNELQKIGIRYCFSAYGGTNTVDFEELNILRQGVDCRFDLLRLRAAIEGWST